MASAQFFQFFNTTEEENSKATKSNQIQQQQKQQKQHIHIHNKYKENKYSEQFEISNNIQYFHLQSQQQQQQLLLLQIHTKDLQGIQFYTKTIPRSNIFYTKTTTTTTRTKTKTKETKKQERKEYQDINRKSFDKNFDQKQNNIFYTNNNNNYNYNNKNINILLERKEQEQETEPEPKTQTQPQTQSQFQTKLELESEKETEGREKRREEKAEAEEDLEKKLQSDLKEETEDEETNWRKERKEFIFIKTFNETNFLPNEQIFKLFLQKVEQLWSSTRIQESSSEGFQQQDNNSLITPDDILGNCIFSKTITTIQNISVDQEIPTDLQSWTIVVVIVVFIFTSSQEFYLFFIYKTKQFAWHHLNKYQLQQKLVNSTTTQSQQQFNCFLSNYIKLLQLQLQQQLEEETTTFCKLFQQFLYIFNKMANTMDPCCQLVSSSHQKYSTLTLAKQQSKHFSIASNYQQIQTKQLLNSKETTRTTAKATTTTTKQFNSIFSTTNFFNNNNRKSNETFNTTISKQIQRKLFYTNNQNFIHFIKTNTNIINNNDNDNNDENKNDCIKELSSLTTNQESVPFTNNSKAIQTIALQNQNQFLSKTKQKTTKNTNTSTTKTKSKTIKQFQSSNNLSSEIKFKSKSASVSTTTLSSVSLPMSSTQTSRTRTSGFSKSSRGFPFENFFTLFTDIPKTTRTFLSLLLIFNMLPLFYAECDQTFVSRIGGPQNGTFSAPILHNYKNHSRQCLYTFLAGPGQRVQVVFKSFNLRGSPPDGSAVGELPACTHEYMDIYSEVQSSEPAELINSPFGGRFCGTIPPRQRISMYRAIAISFFTNKNITTADLFEGTYKFINASEYEVGIPIAGSPCSYTITPSLSINKTGVLISPTYPGAYPKDMSCTYQFLGESNQRVRLEFRDFDLFFGGPHCPFDYVKVYDGPDNSSALIGTYCGQQRNLVLYSSESSLFVHFYTLPRTANTQNRGFKGIYEFSESFVKLDFIRENDGIHMRGSECDQKILSKKESTGFVLSPNYPYPYIPKTVCRYFIYGMQDAQHLERVRLEFSAFNIPKVENKDKSETNCSDGYLKIYLKGQETADAYDKFDYELCGNETQKVISDGPRLAMVFSSGELQGRGFKGKYTFETEYKIPGTAAPDGTCSFTYVSSSKKRGEFNSPRYPSNYPSDTNCSYLFLAEPNEQVTIVFDHFKVKADGNVNATAGALGRSSNCYEDWLEMYVVYRDNNDRLLGRYCGLTAPGPVESPRGAVGLRITLHTDQENVASGFKARYFFETAKSEIGDCGGNFSNDDSGIITSPNYPANYKAPGRGMASMACNWIMTARTGYKLSIHFEHFSIEGDPANRGCPAAVMRLWVNVDTDQPPLELCGEKPPVEQWHYISTGQTARISFTTSDKTVGAQGFRIVWTEIQDSGPPNPAIALGCDPTYHFQCSIGYCIADKLQCDGVKNCGPGDDSDEMNCESYHGTARGGSRRSYYNSTHRRLVPNLSPMHTLSLQKKT